MGESWWLYHWTVLGVLAGGLLHTLLNAWFMPRLPSVRGGMKSRGRVSVLVPARNEARNIERCVRSLQSQNYPDVEIVVLDDRSEDDTAERVRSLGLNEGNGGLLIGQELPGGWVGKNWACHQLAQAARGEFLFFTDADTEHSEGMIAGLVEAMNFHRADLISAWPRQEVEAWAERLVVSLLPFMGLAFYPHTFLWVLDRFEGLRRWVPRRMRRSFGAANGQALFFHRESYRAIDGHRGVAGHLVEDIALGRAVAERMGEGRWWMNVDASQAMRCRMYRNFWEVWEGFTKNVRAAFEESWGRFVAAGLGLWFFYLMPFVMLGLAGQAGRWAAWESALIFGMRIVAVCRVGGSWWGVWMHPMGMMFALAIGLNSWRRSMGSGVVWKGRLYAVESPQKKRS